MKEKRTIQSVQRIISSFFKQQRRMPSYQEMLDLLGVKSKSVVHFWVNELIVASFLERDEKGYLTLTRQSYAIPMVGSVQAGFPSPEEEVLSDIMSMDEYLITKPKKGKHIVLEAASPKYPDITARTEVRIRRRCDCGCQEISCVNSSVIVKLPITERKDLI